jgi:hypothetical protein
VWWVSNIQPDFLRVRIGAAAGVEFPVSDEQDGLSGKKHWKKGDRIMPSSQLSRYFGFETAHGLSPDFG